MRSRALPAMGISVVALAIATSFAGTASAAGSDVQASHKGSAVAIGGADATCFSNLAGDTGTAISSQNFEDSFDAYDNSGADDFKLKKACTVKSIQVPGQYFGAAPSPAESETVTFYKDKKGKPGKVVKSKTVAGTDSGGSFDIKLGKVKLKKGKYWVGVVANLDFGAGSQWGWENTSTQKGKPAMWQNPGDGFGSGCTKWSNMQTCLGGVAPGPDFMFSLTK